MTVSGTRVRAIIALVSLACVATYGVAVGWDATVPAMSAFFATMGVASVIDLAERRVPNRLLLVATPLVVGLFFLAAIVGSADPLGRSLGAGVSLFLIFLVIHLVSPKSFGAGDVKIAFLIGVAIGWFGLGQIQWFLMWMWLGLVGVGIPILRREGRGTNASIPLVPILSVASALTILISAS